MEKTYSVIDYDNYKKVDSFDESDREITRQKYESLGFEVAEDSDKDLIITKENWS